MFMRKYDVPFEDEPLFSIHVMGLRIMEKNVLPKNRQNIAMGATYIFVVERAGFTRFMNFSKIDG